MFSLGSSAAWVGYSLDGKGNVTVAGNTTLTGLSNGEHNVTVYANDTFGNVYSSQTITFTVAKPSPNISFAVTGVAAAVVVVCGGLMVYFKKRKPSTQATAEGQK